MADLEDIRECFRCKGMAVITRGALLRVPAVMARAETQLGQFAALLPEDMADTKDAINLTRQLLKEYMLLLDSVPQD